MYKKYIHTVCVLYFPIKNFIKCFENSIFWNELTTVLLHLPKDPTDMITYFRHTYTYLHIHISNTLFFSKHTDKTLLTSSKMVYLLCTHNSIYLSLWFSIKASTTSFYDIYYV